MFAREQAPVAPLWSALAAVRFWSRPARTTATPIGELAAMAEEAALASKPL